MQQVAHLNAFLGGKQELLSEQPISKLISKFNNLRQILWRIDMLQLA